jgi:hypothetical protein
MGERPHTALASVMSAPTETRVGRPYELPGELLPQPVGDYPVISVLLLWVSFNRTGRGPTGKWGVTPIRVTPECATSDGQRPGWQPRRSGLQVRTCSLGDRGRVVEGLLEDVAEHREGGRPEPGGEAQQPHARVVNWRKGRSLSAGGSEPNGAPAPRITAHSPGRRARVCRNSAYSQLFAHWALER